MIKPVRRILRGRVLSFHRRPTGAGDAGSYRFLPDGIVVVEAGRILAVEPAARLADFASPGPSSRTMGGG